MATTSLTLELLKKATRLWIDETEAVLVIETSEEIETCLSKVTVNKVLVILATVVEKDIILMFEIVMTTIEIEGAADAHLVLQIGTTTRIVGTAGTGLIPRTATTADVMTEAEKQAGNDIRQELKAASLEIAASSTRNTHPTPEEAVENSTVIEAIYSTEKSR
jgi:hypothetical protein